MVTRIIASTSEQASLAASALELEPRQWKHVRYARDLRGATVDNIVVALPILDYQDRNRWAIDVVLSAIEARDGRQAREVPT